MSDSGVRTAGQIGDRVQSLRGARLPGASTLVDLTLADGLVTAVSAAGRDRPSGVVLEADGRWVIPGLWDHHVHMTPWSLRAQRTSLAGLTSPQAAAAALGAVAPDAAGIRVGVGFRDGLWVDPPTLAVLDAATGGVPTYLVNADLHSVWLNSAALRREGLPLVDEGVLREEPAFRVAKALDEVGDDRVDAAVGAAARAAAARGVVGVVDLDMAWNATAWRRRTAQGFDALRVRFGIYPADLPRALAEGLRSDDPVDGAGGLARVGGLKVITDGSLGTRTAACHHPYGEVGTTGLLTVAADQLQDLLAAATAGGLRVHVHAIGDLAVTTALDAFAATGAVGSMEHAQLVAPGDLARFAELGVAASLQPTHAVDDRDLADREWSRTPSLRYPQRAFFDSGATVLFGSDAPVATLDPWVTIANAVARSDDARPGWHLEEAVTTAQALAASTEQGSRGSIRVAPGMVADLALCEADPLTSSPAVLRTMPIGATLLGGRLTHLS